MRTALTLYVFAVLLYGMHILSKAVFDKEFMTMTVGEVRDQLLKRKFISTVAMMIIVVGAAQILRLALRAVL